MNFLAIIILLLCGIILIRRITFKPDSYSFDRYCHLSKETKEYIEDLLYSKYGRYLADPDHVFCPYMTYDELNILGTGFDSAETDYYQNLYMNTVFKLVHERLMKIDLSNIDTSKCFLGCTSLISQPKEEK